MFDLGSIPPSGYLGTLNRQPYYDGVFWTKDNDLYLKYFVLLRKTKVSEQRTRL